ncbi:MAG: VWA domain-containing protein [Candidatus Cloacimonetes bacterium]|nr:VWA domain-containing protein [Candidatus Cloacimonadota bacterium]
MLLGSEASDDYTLRRSLVKLIIKQIQHQELTAAEVALLKSWDKVWQYYENRPVTLEALQSIYSLLSNPDYKYIEFGVDFTASAPSPFNRLFADPMSLKEVATIALNYVRNKLVNDQVVKTVVKGMGEQSTDSNTTFDVQLTSHEIGKIGFRRKQIIGFKHGTGMHQAVGPIVSWSATKYGNAQLAIYQTIKAAISDGSFSREPFEIKVAERHFRYPVYQFKQSFNIMLVLDISNSVRWILKYIEKIISMLTAQASASKDKLGLIVFQEDHAQILHYPTSNVRHVIGTINTLVPKGKTPLADGIKLALQTLEHSRFQVTGMSNAIVLLSDCFPEPITGEYEDQMDEPACQDFLNVSDRIAAAKVRFLVINPGINGIKGYKKNLGYRLGKLAAERAEGNFLNLMADIKRTIDPNDRDYVFSEQMMNQFMQGISDFRTGGV